LQGGVGQILPGGGRSNIATEEYERSKNTNLNKTKNLSKGHNPKTQKGTDEVSTDAHSQRAPGTIGKGKKALQPSKDESHHSPTPILTKPPITQADIERKKAQGRNASGFTPLAGIIPSSHWQELETQAASADPPRNSRNGSNGNGHQTQGHWKQAPKFIQWIIEDWFSRELHDQAIHSTITRVHRIYLAWKQQFPDATAEALEDGFRQRMYDAKEARKGHTIKTKTPTGHTNSTPYFLACLEEKCGLRQPEQPN
jgi:hypothetical protein